MATKIYVGDIYDTLPQVPYADCVITSPPLQLRGTDVRYGSRKGYTRECASLVKMLLSPVICWQAFLDTEDELIEAVKLPVSQIINTPPYKVIVFSEKNFNIPQTNVSTVNEYFYFVCRDCGSILKWMLFNRIPRCQCGSADWIRSYSIQNPKIPELFISYCTKEDDWIFDPFGGTGTTGKVAVQMKRNAILLEETEEAKRLALFRIYKEVDVELPHNGRYGILWTKEQSVTTS